MRIVIDTNILVGSAYNARSASRAIVEAVLRGDLALIVSPAVQREYEFIVRRAVRIPGAMERINELLSKAEVVHPAETPRVVVEDPDDDKFLAAAVARGVDALITNDDHLLPLDPYEGIRILRPSAFLAWKADERDTGTE